MSIKIHKIVVIEQVPAHLGELRTLFLTVRKNAFWWADKSTFDLFDFDKETEGECVLVALLDGRPVGFVSVWLPDNFIHHLFVDDKYHHLGIGTKLLEHVIHNIGLPLRLKCVEKNEVATNFYKRRGFCVKERGLLNNEAFIVMELK